MGSKAAKQSSQWCNVEDRPAGAAKHLSAFRLVIRSTLRLLLLAPLHACAPSADSNQNAATAAPQPPDTLPTLVAISTEPTCPRCTIEIDSVATIGLSTDSVFPMDFAFIVEGADQHFYVAPLSDGMKIGKYDGEGDLQTIFAGRGEAPHQFRALSEMAASPDSMLLILGINRATWYRLDSLTATHQQLSATLNQARALAFRAHHFVATNSGGMPGELLYSEPPPNGTQLGVSLTPSHSEFGTVAGLRMLSHITGDEREWLTISQFFSPTVDVWRGAQRVRHVRLPAPWYRVYDGLEPWKPTRHGVPAGELITSTQSIWRDKHGLVWTITSLPDADLPPDYLHTDRSLVTSKESDAPPPRSRPIREQSDAIVAVYALSDSTITLIASHRFDQNVNRFLSDSVLSESTNPEPGLTRFILYRFRLSGYSP